jgi:hypothetical protein
MEKDDSSSYKGINPGKSISPIIKGRLLMVVN